MDYKFFFSSTDPVVKAELNWLPSFYEDILLLQTENTDTTITLIYTYISNFLKIYPTKSIAIINVTPNDTIAANVITDHKFYKWLNIYDPLLEKLISDQVTVHNISGYSMYLEIFSNLWLRNVDLLFVINFPNLAGDYNFAQTGQILANALALLKMHVSNAMLTITHDFADIFLCNQEINMNISSLTNTPKALSNWMPIINLNRVKVSGAIMPMDNRIVYFRINNVKNLNRDKLQSALLNSRLRNDADLRSVDEATTDLTFDLGEGLVDETTAKQSYLQRNKSAISSTETQVEVDAKLINKIHNIGVLVKMLDSGQMASEKVLFDLKNINLGVILL